MLELNRLYNLDCMQGMKEFPDGFFDLAIVDPPYGIGIDGQRKRVCRNPKHNRKEHSREGWDNEPPSEEYFRELERVSRNQIIWGGNYFVPVLKQAHKGWLVWDKGQRGLSMSDCELAYTSFDTPTRIFTLNRVELHRDKNLFSFLHLFMPAYPAPPLSHSAGAPMSLEDGAPKPITPHRTAFAIPFTMRPTSS